MKILGFVLYFLGGLGLLILAIVMTGAPLRIYWDPFSLVLLLGLQIFASASFSGLLGFVKAFSDPFNKQAEAKDLRRAHSFWKGQTPLSFIAAFVGLLQGGIAIVQNLSDPNAVLKGVALAFLMLGYALVLNLLLFYPYRLLCEKRLTEDKDPVSYFFGS